MSIQVSDPATRCGTGVPDAARRNEIARLNQGVHTDQRVSAPATLQKPSQLENGDSSSLDRSQLSVEALEEISRVGRPEDTRRMDQFVVALQEAFQCKAGDDQRRPPAGTLTR